MDFYGFLEFKTMMRMRENKIMKLEVDAIS